MARGWLAVTLSVGAWAVLLAAPAQAATFYGSPQFQQAWQTAEAATPNFWGPLATARDPQLEP